MNLSNFTYFWFSLLHLPISLSLMVQPKFLTSYLYSAPLYLHDDLLFLLLDVTRLLGCYIFFFVCFTFFMMTVKDRRTRNVFHLAMSLKCLALCTIIFVFILFGSHVWFSTGKWFLFFYYTFGFIVFSFLFYYERRKPITANQAASYVSEAVNHAMKAATFSSSNATAAAPFSSSQMNQPPFSSTYQQQPQHQQQYRPQQSQQPHQMYPAPSSSSSTYHHHQQTQQYSPPPYTSSSSSSMSSSSYGGGMDMGGMPAATQGGLTQRRRMI